MLYFESSTSDHARFDIVVSHFARNASVARPSHYACYAGGAE